MTPAASTASSAAVKASRQAFCDRSAADGCFIGTGPLIDAQPVNTDANKTGIRNSLVIMVNILKLGVPGIK
jgi:hypothetical protein